MGKRKTYDSFNAWYKDQPTNKKTIINKLRKLVRSTSPKLTESSKWTNGVWLKGDVPIAYLHTEPDHVQLGFFHGAALNDPKGILEGKGKQVRFIRVARASDILEDEFSTMVRRATRFAGK